MEVVQTSSAIRRSLLGIMTAVGCALIVLSLLHIATRGTGPWMPFIFIMLLFAFTSRLSMVLPSGANWRPALMILMPSIFILPVWMLPLVSIPGLTLLTPKSRQKWRHYPITFAHVALGLTAGSVVFHYGLTLVPLNFPFIYTMLAAVLALATHLIVNRVLSALIVANRQERPFSQQLRLMTGELHWGYFSSYLVVLMTASIVISDLWWALILNVLTQLGLYKIMSYYRQLQESEQRYRSLKEHHPDGICSLNMEGNFFSQNPAFAQLLGYPNEILYHMTVTELIDQEDTSAVESCKRLLACDADREIELSLRHRRGMTVHASCTGVPIIVEGRQRGIYLIVKDVAEQKRTEELMRQSDKLAIVGQLAAGVAHEIRNPLTSLKGFVQLMRSSNVTDGHQRYLSIMENELSRIEVVAGEFLMLAKPQAVRMGRVDLCHTVSDVAALLSTLAMMRSIQIRTEVLGDIPLLACDENQLKQVFINIAKNGIEAMETGTLKFRLRASQTTVFIDIEDEGVGIPEDALKMVGSPFYTTKPQGTGLGLTVSHRIVSSYNGQMQIYSRTGQGTVVTISLPVPVSKKVNALVRS